VRAQVADLTKQKQSPWASTNLTGLFYMNQTASAAPVAAAPAAVPQQTAVPSSDASSVEVGFWRSVQGSNKPEELNAYLTRYPKGAFSSIARSRIAALENPSTVSRSASPMTPEIDPAAKTAEANLKTEEDLNLDGDAKRDIQRRLKGLGFSTPVTGKFNDETRKAITNWQQMRGFPVSGFLNQPAVRCDEE
jgi:hypothetical protein